MLLAILLFPLVSFLITFFVGYVLGRTTAHGIAVYAIIMAFFHSITALINYISSQKIIEIIFIDWIVTKDIHLQLGCMFDGISLVMCVIITAISACVHIYAIGYMSADPHIQLFTAYLSLFTFFMLLLVTSNNLLFMYFGWEGVGIMSYLLINYWDTRTLANKAALKAMIVNRISDAFFFIGILLLLGSYKTVNFSELSTIVNNQEIPLYSTTWYNILNISCFFLLFGVFGKSAQIIFHVWLPDAMEGPTPVSALLHAATMVTAGVILLLRCSVIMSYCPSILHVVTIFGSITATMAAFASVFQIDIKKVIAYSTCSQLGYMIMACGLSYYNVALFHLFNHAFFKALLFLGAGSIIHAVADEQDMRKMGGLINFLPFTFFCMVIGSIAIMGIPFFSGFYSKDLILELTYNSYFFNSIILYFLSLSAAFCTALYSIRLLLFVFFFKSKSYHVIAPQEPENYMTTALTVLFILSIFGGYIFSDFFIGLGNNLLSDTGMYLPLNYYYTNQFLVNPLIKNLPLIASIVACVGGMLIITVMYKKPKINNKVYYIILNIIQNISALSYHGLYFNILYNDLFIFSYKVSYSINTKLIDKGIYEYLGPVGIYRLFYLLSNEIRNISPSIFLSLGFMFSCLVIMYCYFAVSVYLISYYLLNFGIFVNLFLIFYNEIKYNNL